MLELELSSKFRKDLKKIIKQNKDKDKLNQVVKLLQMENPLPDKYRDHMLTGNWNSFRECHITPDWLLIYKVVEGNVRLLRLVRTGSHSELFKK